MFSLNFLGPGFNSISPWQSRKQDIYINVSKKNILYFQNNDNKEALFQTQ